MIFLSPPQLKSIAGLIDRKAESFVLEKSPQDAGDCLVTVWDRNHRSRQLVVNSRGKQRSINNGT
jgi:hypothetical protein